MKQNRSFLVGLLMFGVSIAVAGPVRADMFEFEFTFDNPAINVIADANGGRFGSLSFDGPASAGVFTWDTFTNLEMSYTLGSDVYDLSHFIDTLETIEMTIGFVGKKLQITDIDDIPGNFAQFIIPGAPSFTSLGFSDPTGRFGAVSSQWAGQENGSFVAVIPAPGAVVLAMLGLPMVGWVKRRFQ